MKASLYLKDVSSIQLDISKCSGCRMCTIVCPHGVFEMMDKKAFITDKDKCMECGACAKNCEWSAITVRTGVGCAYGILNGMLTGKEASCDCGSGCC